jgi:hypothetical protein
MVLPHGEKNNSTLRKLILSYCYNIKEQEVLGRSNRLLSIHCKLEYLIRQAGKTVVRMSKEINKTI